MPADALVAGAETGAGVLIDDAEAGMFAQVAAGNPALHQGDDGGMQDGGAGLRRDLRHVLHVVGEAAGRGGGFIDQDRVAVLRGEFAIGDAGLRVGAFGQHARHVIGAVQSAQDGEAVRLEKHVQLVQRILPEDAKFGIDADHASHASWRPCLRAEGKGRRAVALQMG